MKPIMVSMQAFGPFAGRQIIDFRELGSKTFFLIHGPTGSGKTSILDGICFALFGDCSGGEREGRQMRSHHADSSTLTEVSFDFALGPERYRVRRVPEQMRKAIHGGGEVKQVQKAELWRIDVVDGKENEQPLTSGWTKVTEAIVGLLGFESQQFRQVIMLPQGKFFEFLKSNSQEREKILQALFGTEIYKRIEEALKLSANTVSREAEKVSTQRRTLMDQAQVENEGALEARRQQQADDLKSRRGAEQVAASAAQAAEKTLVEARRVSDRFAEFDKASIAFQTLHGEQPLWAGRLAQLACARRAESIRPYEVALIELGKHVNDEAGRGEKLATELVVTIEAARIAAAALDREGLRAPEIEKAVARIAELGVLVGKVAALATTRAEHIAADAESIRAATAVQTGQQGLKVATAALQKLATDVQDGRVHAAGVEGLRATQAKLKMQFEQASVLAARIQELAALATQVSARRASLNTVGISVLDARKKRDETRQAWIAGQAARLAHELVDGQACPVCGAHEHPVTATSSIALVVDNMLQAAEHALGAAETAQRAAMQTLADGQQAASLLEARIADIKVTLGESPASPAQLKAQADAGQAALTRAELAAKALPTLLAAFPAAELAVNAAEGAVKVAETAALQAQGKLHQIAGQLIEREAGVPADLGDPKALQSARVAAEKTRDVLRQAFDAATAIATQANSKLTETRTRADASEQTKARLVAQQREKVAELSELLTAVGFVDAEAYRSAWLDDAAVATLDAGIRTFEKSLAACSDRQTRALTETRNLIRPDLAGILAIHDAARALQLTTSNAVRDEIAALAATTDFSRSLRQMSGAFQELEARYAVLKQVADVAGGANAHRMSFQRYVLATLLEEVLAATTLRLRIMSRGRYEIRRKIEPVDQRVAAGLDLETFDQYTGTTRPVNTLSGGESFLASLALALGLSDVVQSYAGGIRLDAIFVDEGFGTLDPEALDVAVRALKDLQNAGRMVGIISHVAELKEWIDARLELKATQNGSVATFVQ